MLENKGLKKLYDSLNAHEVDLTPPINNNDPYNPKLNFNSQLPFAIDIKKEKRWFRDYTHYYINDVVRIEYGYHFSESEKSYWLQHYVKKKWRKKNWTYGSVFNGNLMNIIRYFLLQ